MKKALAGARNISRARAAARNNNHTRASGTAITAGARQASRTTIYVGNLPKQTTSTHIWDHFAQFGTIRRNGIYLRPHEPSSTTSFGFVRYLEEAAVEKALKAAPLMIGNHSIKVERQLHEREEINAVFTTKLPVFHELVLSLYYKKNELKVGIHGYWICNVINGKVVITHQNKEKVDRSMTKQIESMVKTKLEAMGLENARLWRGKGKKSTAPKNLIHETKVHNLYNGEIYNPNCIEEATALASPYTDPSGPRSLLAFFHKFKEHLNDKIKEEPKARDNAMPIFFEFAAKHYGRYLRISVKTSEHIDFAFMSDEEKNPINHTDDVAKGSPADFLKFCQM